MSEPHEVKVVLREGMHFEGFTGQPGEEDFAIQLDGDASSGGQGLGHRPVKMVLVGLAGCMAMDVLSILRKKQQTVSDLEVRVSAEHADEHPKIYTHITVTFVVAGRQIEPAAVARAIELSYTRYCAVANLLKPVVSIETAYKIVEG